MPEVNPFVFLDRSLNLLIVDDELEDRRMLLDLLGPVRCFNLHSAATNHDALALLQSGERFHACITELGLTDVDNDSFHLIRQYARHCSMILLTRSTSPGSGAAAIQLGVRAVFDKGHAFNPHLFFTVLCRMTLVNIVYHRWNEWAGDTLSNAVKALFETNPASVTQWAETLKLSDRQLRNLWHFNCGFGAKQVLFLYQCFRDAFDYYGTLLFGNNEQTGPSQRTATKTNRFRYYEDHREVLSFMLS